MRAFSPNGEAPTFYGLVTYFIICIGSAAALSFVDWKKIWPRVAVASVQSLMIVSAILTINFTRETTPAEVLLGIAFGLGLYAFPITLVMLLGMKYIRSATSGREATQSEESTSMDSNQS